MAHRVCLAHENRILWNIYPKHTEPIHYPVLGLHGRHRQFSGTDHGITHRIPIDDLGVQNDESRLDATTELI